MGSCPHNQSFFTSFYAPHFSLYSSPNCCHHTTLFADAFPFFLCWSTPTHCSQKPSLIASLTSWDPCTSPPMDPPSSPFSCNCVCTRICLPSIRRPDIPQTVRTEAKVLWTPCPHTRYRGHPRRAHHPDMKVRGGGLIGS